ncbi:MAG: DNA repair protein RecN, partial [Anaerolineae bacterium]|nr:DNA repair protein RecN [Anaerolineae bacterium]
VGGIVGKKLWGLSRTDGGEHQVFCVTHLPQLAGYADLHLRVQKSLSGDRTTTTVELLEEDERIDELAQMLGGVGENTRQIARELLAQDSHQHES